MATLHAEPLVFHASASGQPTLDRDAGGGNPFASALVEILALQSLSLSDLPLRLQHLTAVKSNGFQRPQVPHLTGLVNWHLVPPRRGETRTAMVLVVSDYAKSGAPSLPGARYDARRVAAALVKAGFSTEIVLDHDAMRMRQKLAAFAALSKSSDAAIVYTTGHGVENDGKVFLLPGDYPIDAGRSVLTNRAIPLTEIAASAHARQINLVFYGGCRDNPLK